MKKRILIVEDEVFIAEELSYIVQELGFEITDIAFDAQSAINSLKKSEPDLAILDIRMHGRNQGFEIARYIKENLDIPFLFLTSFADKTTVEEAALLKPSAYILKPFNNLDIYSTLSVLTTEIDGSVTNEIQNISLSGTNLTLSGGSTINLSVIDTDTHIDSTGIAGLGFVAGPHKMVDYSYSEQATGRHWVDGKEIYTQTFVRSETAFLVESFESWSLRNIQEEGRRSTCTVLFRGI